MSKRWFFRQMYIYDSKADGFATLSEVLLHIAENPRHCGRQKGTSRAQVSNAASFYSNVRHGILLKTFPRRIFFKESKYALLLQKRKEQKGKKG